ncbi:dTDP-6-deoxy-L-lyxo-4-hexulose reductase [Gordonia effusa NBRC 100432]|uniref:dTDP-4-dehydrorhamnose reductase n=1 Tax=Gordonia effusa NBRC 100432 TaxID=1077974 RepID=H0QVW2_9ACTN|nr:dTDP-4-dehydrorhamnose reductase [Gordonia effusa]GAB16963.1 dTDP-6-deoxy-L-lyxo-4-hexulose reductase [Gordonia effusa NBRC 100432]
MNAGVVLITGAGGQLGRALLATAPNDLRVVPLTSRDLNIADDAAVARRFGELSPDDVVINCAAYTNVDGAESKREEAWAGNVHGPANLAGACAASGAWLIHISTDYVFDGPAAGGGIVSSRTAAYEPAEAAASTPPTVYGETKLAGERAALKANPDVTVVRTAWVYTGRQDSADFVGTMRRLAAQRDILSVVDDQTGSPTYAIDLARGLWELAAMPRRRVAGAVLHATNAGRATWWELTREIFVDLSLDPQRVQRCTTDEFPRPAPRPAFSVLSGASWAQAGLTPFRDWRRALSDALSED